MPGLYTIFDGILVDTANNKQRDSKMMNIHIDINAKKNTISVRSNGKGNIIPVESGTMSLPTALQLCNIFSTQFAIEIGSKEQKKCFTQTW